jgi:hypothetical protein
VFAKKLVKSEGGWKGEWEAGLIMMGNAAITMYRSWSLSNHR